MFAYMQATLLSLQPNSNMQVNIAGTSTTNPIILLSAANNRNNLSEPAVNTNNRPVEVNNEPIRCSLFQDHVGVSPTPDVTLSHTSKDIQVQIPTRVLEQVSVPQQVQETDRAPTTVNIGFFVVLMKRIQLGTMVPSLSQFRLHNWHSWNHCVLFIL